MENFEKCPKTGLFLEKDEHFHLHLLAFFLFLHLSLTLFSLATPYLPCLLLLRPGKFHILNYETNHKKL